MKKTTFFEITGENTIALNMNQEQYTALASLLLHDRANSYIEITEELNCNSEEVSQVSPSIAN